jgi:VIT1/CCC1 family predicted Fe2+/Mn2+ transporter
MFLAALFTMIGIVVLIIAGFTYYISVAKGERFKPRFLEMTLLSVGVAVISFVVGVLAKQFLGVDI